MSHHTSEQYIQELSEKVRQAVEQWPTQRLTAKAILATALDRTKPIEYRKQLLLRFLNHHNEVGEVSQ